MEEDGGLPPLLSLPKTVEEDGKEETAAAASLPRNEERKGRSVGGGLSVKERAPFPPSLFPPLFLTVFLPPPPSSSPASLSQ